jgi:hypothetical protein
MLPSVNQLLVQGRWFSPGSPASPTTKTGRHDIAEILLKVALNTKICYNTAFLNLKSQVRGGQDNLWCLLVHVILPLFDRGKYIIFILFSILYLYISVLW